MELMRTMKPVPPSISMRAGPRAPKNADVVLGQRLKLRRIALGITQKEVAKTLALSFQQIQKYESGKNRLTAITLEQIAELYEVPVSYFHDEASTIERQIGDFDPLTWRVVRAFPRIKSKALRLKLAGLIEHIANEVS